MFPKVRPPLPKNYQDIYDDHFVANRAGVGLAHRLTVFMERWMHKRISRLGNEEQDILEIGAGNLNHLKFEKFKCYDVIEPNIVILEGSNKESKRIRNRFSNIDEINDFQYDRVISIAVLEHIEDLPSLLVTSKKLLKKKCFFQAAIPTEGGFLWYLFSYVLKGLIFRFKYGLDYKILMAHEHLNTEEEIIGLVRETFDQVKVIRYPTRFKHLSLYSYIEAS